MRAIMRRRSWVLAAASALLAILLVVLGTLQLRWLDQVARTLTAEKRASLYRRGSAVATDLDRELARLFFWFQLDETADPESRFRVLAERWNSFQRAGRHVPLVAQLWLVNRGQDREPSEQDDERDRQGDREEPTLLGLDLATGATAAARWPPGTAALERQINDGFPAFGLLRTEAGFAGLLLAVPADRPGPPRGGRPLVLIRLDAAYLGDRLLPAVAEPHLGPGQGDPAVLELKDGDGHRRFTWPAGIDPVRPDEHDPILLAGVRPDLVSNALLAGMRPPRRLPLEEFFVGSSPRGGQRILGGFGPEGRGGPPGPGARMVFGPGGPPVPGGPRRTREMRQLRGLPPGGPPTRPMMWQLSLGYAAGPVDALVTGLRRRNLAFGFSILGLLGGAIGALGVAVRRAQTLAERQRQMMASVSHELRTPLAVIGAAAENLRDGTVEEGERVREYGEMIHTESKRLTAMVDDVLRLAAGQDLGANLRFERMDVRDVVETAIDSFQQELRARGGTLETVVRAEAEGATMVMVDAEALRQAVENVVGNAIKYGGDPPTVTVRISRVETPAGVQVQIAVEDRGLGIPRDELRLVFDPFFRGREAMKRQIRGTGLGLSLVDRVMKAHGGKVVVESAPGRGSRFVLSLPAAVTLPLPRPPPDPRS
jgi:signal transduction histidine kinase